MDGNPPVTLIVDSGADFHVVGNRDLLIDIVGSSKKLRTAKGEDLGVVGVGTLVRTLGTYTDIHGVRRILDLQLPNVYYAPECCYNLLSLSQLNAENIHLNTEVRSVIFPAPVGMETPSPIGPKLICQYKHCSLHQKIDRKGNPVLWARYDVDNKPTLRGWLNNSGQTWVEKTGIVAAVSAIDYEAGEET